MWDLTNTCWDLDWNQLQKKCTKVEWARKSAQVLAAEYVQWQERYPTQPPLEASDWAHFYFCDTCSTHLIFKPETPQKHRCPTCGKVYTGEPYDGTWRKFIHAEIIVNLQRGALLANLTADNKAYLDYIHDTLLFYVDHYADYEVHGEHAGKGKIMPQSLTEAIFLIDVAVVLQLTDRFDIFSDDEGQRLREQYFRPAAILLKEQIRAIHNIHAWMDSAVYIAGRILGDEGLMDFALNGEFGWHNQLEQGCNDDGYWYEGSIGYHFYTLSALRSLVQFYPEPRALCRIEQFQKMFKAPLKLAYYDVFPAHNDCLRNLPISRYAGSYEWAARFMPEEQHFCKDLATLYQQQRKLRAFEYLGNIPNRLNTEIPLHQRNSTAALLWGEVDLPEAATATATTVHYPATGISILQNETLRLTCRYSPYGGWHDHNDKLTIELAVEKEEFSADLGTPGYGSELCGRWYRTPPAHNMVIINQQQQQPSNGVMIDRSATHVTAQANDAYAGCQLQRHLELLENGWKDRFSVVCEESCTIDWCFHAMGDIHSELGLTPAAPFKDENGYNVLTELQCGEEDEDWQIVWHHALGRLTLTMQGEAGTQVYLGRCPDNPSSQTLGIVLVRRQCQETLFNATFDWQVNNR